MEVLREVRGVEVGGGEGCGRWRREIGWKGDGECRWCEKIEEVD